jgi:hypothetical protein
MKLDKLEKIFEEQQKLIQVTLSSDPAKKNKKYIGFLVNEQPATEPKIKTGVLGKAAQAAKSVGNTFNTLNKLNQGLSDISKGDLSVLEKIGNWYLEKLLDKQTSKVSLFGKKGYDVILLNDKDILSKLNSYTYTPKNTKVKEGFVNKIEKVIKLFEQPGEQFDFPNIIPPAPKKDKEIKFTSKNMYFKVGKSTRYNAVDMYLLTPMKTEVSNKLKELGIKMVALAKTFSGDVITNEVTIYFYYDNNNVIPRLTTTGLKIAFDKNFNAYVIGARIRIDTGIDTTKFKNLLVVDNNFEILKVFAKNRKVSFRINSSSDMKNLPEEFKEEYYKLYTKQQGGDTIYGNITGTYAVNAYGQSVGGNVFYVDTSTIQVNYGIGNEKIPTENTPFKGKQAKTKPQPETQPETSAITKQERVKKSKAAKT